MGLLVLPLIVVDVGSLFDVCLRALLGRKQVAPSLC